MTILKRQGPQGGLDTIRTALFDLGAAARMDVLGGTRPPDVIEPLPVFTLGLAEAAEIVHDRLAEQGEPGEWRYLLVSDGDVAAADVVASGGEPSLSRMTEGDFVRRLRAALGVVGTQFAEAPAEYELRVLQVPAVNMAAIWLFRPEGSEFVPFLDAARLKGEAPAVDPGFLDTLRQTAAARLGSAGEGGTAP